MSVRRQGGCPAITSPDGSFFDQVTDAGLATVAAFVE
jgi:hypothetical protein